DLAPEPDSFTSHAVTPLTERTARYFYMFGRRPQGNETTLDIKKEERAFAEDKRMIEAQQRNMDLLPASRLIATTADEGIVLYNRLVDIWIQREADRPPS